MSRPESLSHFLSCRCEYALLKTNHMQNSETLTVAVSTEPAPEKPGASSPKPQPVLRLDDAMKRHLSTLQNGLGQAGPTLVDFDLTEAPPEVAVHSCHPVAPTLTQCGLRLQVRPGIACGSNPSTK